MVDMLDWEKKYHEIISISVDVYGQKYKNRMLKNYQTLDTERTIMVEKEIFKYEGI